MEERSHNPTPAARPTCRRQSPDASKNGSLTGVWRLASDDGLWRWSSTPALTRAFDIADEVSRLGGFHLLPDEDVLCLYHAEGSDDESDGSNGDRVVKSGIDIPGLRHDPQADQRQQSAEDTISDMVGQRQRR